MASTNIQPYYTVQEASEIMKSAPRTIYSYIKSGKLEGTKTAAGTWRISQKSILKFLGVEEGQE